MLENRDLTVNPEEYKTEILPKLKQKIKLLDIKETRGYSTVKMGGGLAR